MLDAPAVPLAAIDPDCVLHISSFSKVIGPSVRVGLLRMPRRVRHARGLALRATTLMASSLSVEWVIRIVDRPVIDRVVGAVRHEMRARQRILTDNMPGDRLITRPEAFYCWLKLTNGWVRRRLPRPQDRAGLASLRSTSSSIQAASNGRRAGGSQRAPSRAALEDAIRRLGNLCCEAHRRMREEGAPDASK